MAHTVDIQSNPHFETDHEHGLYSHVVVCSCGHLSLAPSESFAELHAGKHGHMHRVVEGD